MANFGLIKKFDIDGGELAALSPEQSFVLGYELAQIDNLLSLDGAINKPINADNRERIEAACRDSGREFLLKWVPGDSSESWMWLEVAPREQ